MTDKPIDEIIEKLRMYCSMTGHRPDGIEGVDYEILSDAQFMVKVPELESLLNEVERLREALSKITERRLDTPDHESIIDDLQGIAAEALKNSTTEDDPSGFHVGQRVRSLYGGGVRVVTGIDVDRLKFKTYDATEKHSVDFYAPMDEWEPVEGDDE